MERRYPKVTSTASKRGYNSGNTKQSSPQNAAEIKNAITALFFFASTSITNTPHRVAAKEDMLAQRYRPKRLQKAVII